MRTRDKQVTHLVLTLAFAAFVVINVCDGGPSGRKNPGLLDLIGKEQVVYLNETDDLEESPGPKDTSRQKASDRDDLETSVDHDPNKYSRHDPDENSKQKVSDRYDLEASVHRDPDKYSRHDSDEYSRQKASDRDDLYKSVDYDPDDLDRSVDYDYGYDSDDNSDRDRQVLDRDRFDHDPDKHHRQRAGNDRKSVSVDELPTFPKRLDHTTDNDGEYLNLHDLDFIDKDVFMTEEPDDMDPLYFTYEFNDSIIDLGSVKDDDCAGNITCENGKQKENFLGYPSEVVTCCTGEEYNEKLGLTGVRVARCFWNDDNFEEYALDYYSHNYNVKSNVEELILTPLCARTHCPFLHELIEVASKVQTLSSLTLDGNSGITSTLLHSLLTVWPRLQMLSVRGCKLTSTTFRDTFRNLKRSNIRVLWLGDNSFKGTLDMRSLYPLKHLRDLDFSHGCIQYVTISKHLYEVVPALLLEVLNLSSNSLAHFPRTCNGNRYNKTYTSSDHPSAVSVSLYPNLTRLDLSKNEIHQSERVIDICLPNLQYLDLSGNKFKPAEDSVFYFSDFPSLRYLNLGLQWADSMFYLEGKTLVDRRNQSQAVFLKNAPALQTLILDGSNFHMVDENRFLDILGHLKTLRKLSLVNCKLEFISALMLAPFLDLSTLDLRGNAIASIPDGCFDALTNLKQLDLSGNKVTVIGKDTFRSKLLNQLRGSIRLEHNPYVCSCDLLWFRTWFALDNSLRGTSNSAIDKNKYRCYNLQGTPLIDFTLQEQACLLSRTTSIQIIFSCSFMIITFTVFTLVFRYRWHLRLVLYEAFRGDGEIRRRHLLYGTFKYDVFVSYASENLPWVRRHIMPQLEENQGLKLCIHDREFIPGKNIVDNIVDSVESSKKIVMLFSRAFIRSQWCQFELAFCLRHVLEHEDALIVICLDDVASLEMPSAMIAVMKTTTYIQWENTKDAIHSFWGRIRQGLEEILCTAENAV